MRNTLETKTIDQLHTALVSYNSYMCDIPETFPVLPEYLYGLTETQFCSAFVQFEQIMTKIYTHLSEHPESAGLTVLDKKTGEWKVQSSQHISCVKKLLYVLGRFSEPDGDALHIPMNTLMNAYMTYYPNTSVELADTVKESDREKQDKFYTTKHMRMVFDCLTTFGFVFDGLDVPETQALDMVSRKSGGADGTSCLCIRKNMPDQLRIRLCQMQLPGICPSAGWKTAVV